MMETLPPNLQEILLSGYNIAPSANDRTLAGLAFHAPKGTALFVATRQQLLDIAEDCRKAAEAMPKPS